MNSHPASWVIVRKRDSKAIFETFCQRTAEIVQQRYYASHRVIPILEYLESLNTRRLNAPK